MVDEKWLNKNTLIWHTSELWVRGSRKNHIKPCNRGWRGVKSTTCGDGRLIFKHSTMLSRAMEYLTNLFIMSNEMWKKAWNEISIKLKLEIRQTSDLFLRTRSLGVWGFCVRVHTRRYGGDNFFKSQQRTFISSSSICNLFFGRAHNSSCVLFFVSISHLFSSRLALPPTTATCFVPLALRRREKSKIYYIFNLNARCCYDFIFRSSQSARLVLYAQYRRRRNLATSHHASTAPCEISLLSQLVSKAHFQQFPFLLNFSHTGVLCKKEEKKPATTTTMMIMTMRNLKFKYNFTWSRHGRLTWKVRRCWHQTMQSCHQTIDSFMSSPQLSSSYYAGINDRLCMSQFLHTRSAADEWTANFLRRCKQRAISAAVSEF